MKQNVDGSVAAAVVEAVSTGQATWNAFPLALAPAPGPNTRTLAAAIASTAQDAVAAGQLCAG